jgi:iron complex outermembrane recepter protein
MAVATALTCARLHAQPEPSVVPTPTDAEIVELEKFEVRAQRAVGYTVAETSFGSKTGTQLRDVPASVQILNQAFIQDTGAIAPDALLKNVSGITRGASSEGNYGYANNYFARGLDVKIIRDGFTEGLGRYGNYSRTLFDVERIEVLKGPGSALYGSGHGGGTINFVSKTPAVTPAYSLRLLAGDWGLRGAAVSATGPVGPARDVLYRVDASSRRADGFRDLGEQSVETVTTLQWHPAAAHTLTAKLSYRDIRREPDTVGLPIKSGQVAPLDHETRLYTPFADSRTELLHLALTHAWEIAPDLTLRTQLVGVDRSLHILRNRSSVNGANPADPLTFTLTGRRFDDQQDDTQEFIAQSEAIWKTTTGSIAHTFLAGTELHEVRTDSAMRYANLANIADIRSPVLPEQTLSDVLFAPAFDRDLSLHRYALYLQDELKITEQLKARLGGRFDYFQIRDAGLYNTAGSSLHTTTLAANGQSFIPKANPVFGYEDNRDLSKTLTGQAGLVYQPVPATSFFTGWATGSKANYDTESLRSAYAPERYRQIEVGNKSSFLRDHVSFTAALYDTRRSNFLQTIAGVPQTVGGTKTTGAELDLSLAPVNGLTVIASYARQRARYTQLAATADIGKRVASVPDTLASLWTTYQFPTGPLKGFGLGAGLSHKDGIYVDQANLQQIPGYTTADAALFYRRAGWELHLAINNLTDRTWYAKAANTAATPGDPRNVQLSLTTKF